MVSKVRIKNLEVKSMVSIFRDSLSLYKVIILFNFYFFLFTLVSATKLHNFPDTSKPQPLNL